MLVASKGSLRHGFTVTAFARNQERGRIQLCKLHTKGKGASPDYELTEGLGDGAVPMPRCCARHCVAASNKLVVKGSGLCAAGAWPRALRN